MLVPTRNTCDNTEPAHSSIVMEEWEPRGGGENPPIIGISTAVYIPAYSALEWVRWLREAAGGRHAAGKWSIYIIRPSDADINRKGDNPHHTHTHPRALNRGEGGISSKPSFNPPQRGRSEKTSQYSCLPPKDCCCTRYKKNVATETGHPGHTT